MIPWRGMQPSTARDSGQVDPRRSTTDILPPQSAALGLHPVARRLLRINRPRRDGTLSRRWYAAVTGGSRTRDLAIAKSSLVPLSHRVQSNISSKLLQLESSNLVHSFLFEKPSGRANNFIQKGRGLGQIEIEHGFTSAPTQYRLYGRRFLQV